MHVHDKRVLDYWTDEVRRECALSKSKLYPDIETPEGLTFLGCGISRIGFLLPCGEHVLKVSYNFDLEQTKFERAKWEEAIGKPELKQLLCPITQEDYNNYWVVMEYAPELGFRHSESAGSLHIELEERLFDFDIGDQHSGNVGWLNGRLVSIDYGIGGFVKPNAKFWQLFFDEVQNV